MISTKIKNDINNYVRSLINEWEVPGLALCVVNDNDILYLENFGFSDFEKKVKVNSNTLFNIGSCTKSFTATLTGILVEENKLNWYEPIKKYINNINFFNQNLTDNINLVDVLSHRTGLSNNEEILDGKVYKSGKDLLNILKYIPISEAFRDSFMYNNILYTLIDYLIGEVTNNKYKNVIKEKIFNPIEMNNSNTSWNELFKSKYYSYSYEKNKDDNIIKIEENVDKENFFVSAGGINSTIDDLSKWLIFNLNKGKNKNNQLLSEKTMFFIHSPKIVVENKKYSNEFSYNHYSLGWYSTTYKGHYFLNHGGQVNGYTSLMTLMPNDKIGIAVISNLKSNPVPYIISLYIYEKMLNLNYTNWNDKFKEQKNKKKDDLIDEEEILINNHSKILNSKKDYLGTFEHVAFGKVEILLENNILIMFTEKEEKILLEHYNYDIFEKKLNNKECGKIRFNRTYNGIVKSLSFEINNGRNKTIEIILDKI